MPRHSPSRILYAALSSAVVVALAGCAAGSDAQSLQPYQAAEGTNAQSGTIAVRNLMIMADADGKGELHAAIVNTGSTEDKLVSIAAGEDEEGVKVEGSRAFPLLTKRSLLLPPQTGKPIAVTGAEPGEMVSLTLTFDEAAPITTQVQVLTEDHFSPTPRETEGH